MKNYLFLLLFVIIGFSCDENDETNQEQDYQNLVNMFNDISQISQSTSCNNSDEWSFTAYGSKACGGPQGFIAYSNKIDTTVFLQKVKEYTEAEKQYNIKWSVVSTCDITQQPKSIKCENGKSVLKY